MAFLATAALSISPAAAIVANVNTGAETVTIGVQPRSTTLLDGLQTSAQGFANPEGHPVMHSSATYAIYWDPDYGYHGDWENLIDTFLQRAGAQSGTTGNVFSIDEQYTDAGNQRAAYAEAFRGAYHDVNGYPASGCVDPDTIGGYPVAAAQLDNVACLTDQQLREQLQAFIAANKLPTGMGVSFLLLTPPGVTVCVDKGGALTSHCSDTLESGDGFCSYHAAISPGNPTQGDAETVLYAAIPWSAGGAGDFHLAD